MEKEKVLRVTTPRANKQHICDVCGKPIEKGEKYLNTTIKVGAKLVSRKTHLDCSEKKEKATACIPGSVLTEEQFRQKVHEDTLDMLESFTFKENMQIAFVPLVMTEVAWYYAFKAIKKAADYRIEETKKLSRSVKDLRNTYLAECGKDLNKEHLGRMADISVEFIRRCGNDFLLLWFSINNELKKHWGDVKYQDMRTEAVISMVIIQMVREHSRKMDELMAKRLKTEVPSYERPIDDKLYKYMGEYVSPCSIKYDGNVRTSMLILQNKFNSIEWNVVK